MLTHTPTLRNQNLILTGDTKAINNWVTRGKAVKLFKPWRPGLGQGGMRENSHKTMWVAPPPIGPILGCEWLAGVEKTQVWTSNLANLLGAPSSLTSGPSFLISRAQVDDSLPLQSLQLPLATPRVFSPSPGGKPSQPAKNTCLLLSFPPSSAPAPDALSPDLFFPKCRLEKRGSRPLDQTQEQAL